MDPQTHSLRFAKSIHILFVLAHNADLIESSLGAMADRRSQIGIGMFIEVCWIISWLGSWVDTGPSILRCITYPYEFDILSIAKYEQIHHIYTPDLLETTEIACTRLITCCISDRKNHSEWVSEVAEHEYFAKYLDMLKN